ALQRGQSVPIEEDPQQCGNGKGHLCADRGHGNSCLLGGDGHKVEDADKKHAHGQGSPCPGCFQDLSRVHLPFIEKQTDRTGRDIIEDDGIEGLDPHRFVPLENYKDKGGAQDAQGQVDHGFRRVLSWVMSSLPNCRFHTWIPNCAAASVFSAKSSTKKVSPALSRFRSSTNSKISRSGLRMPISWER